jgi:ATP-dependent Lon protease
MKDKDEVLIDIDKSESRKMIIPKSIPIIPARDIIIFPNMIYPILIGRATTLKAVSVAIENEKYIFVTAQKNPETDEPGFKDIYKNGTISKIIQVLRLPNNMLKVLVEGVMQGRIVKTKKKKEYLEAEIEPVHIESDESDIETAATVRRGSELFAQYVKSNRNISNDLLIAYENIQDPSRKLYFAAANMQQKMHVKQEILEAKDLKGQYFALSAILAQELDMLKIEEEVDSKVQGAIQKTQRKYYIQEQIRALQSELEDDEALSPDLAALKEAIEKSRMPEHALAKANEEFEKLKKTPPMSPDFAVGRSYIELMTQLPWAVSTKDDMDITHVKRILDEDHYDLEKPKERILEYIAILNLTGNLKRQILCFSGPPGVGKTSLAKSIARALGRKFTRISLGGVRDEAEIRGHRRTYIGALPGKIIQAMKKTGVTNPVILLDEIDKLASDFRGDPSSALLEVLDPEQNNAFNDHYLEVDYDLSSVLFITTANVKHQIPAPLLDRMETIELGSYLDYQKYEIAARHIAPKIMKEYGLDAYKIEFSKEAIYKIIQEYTREAGVRNLEREIGSILRKFAKELIVDFNSKNKVNGVANESVETEQVVSAEENNYFLGADPKFIAKMKRKKFIIKPEDIEKYLKAPRFKVKNEDLEAKVGVVTGLAWTSVGGDILPIEVNIMPGSEKLTLTGKLGDVMKESAITALSYVRANYKEFGIPDNFTEKKEIHIHVPEGAIPKDGPSAGVTMACALISAATGKAARGDVAMTGEITLRGAVLPIGGLSEKLLAARRSGKTTVFVPNDNMRDVEDIADEIKEGMTIIPAKVLSDVTSKLFI